jgi:hypothetical protein
MSSIIVRNILKCPNSSRHLPDGRDGESVDYTIHDVMMSAFAMMYFQDPSLLQFQKSLEDEAHTNNLKTLFQVSSVPKDSQMREVIDEGDSRELEPLFEHFFRPLQRGKHLGRDRVLGKYYLVSLDGSGYFGSNAVHCPGCLTREKKKGGVRYEHQIVQAALMHPRIRQVIPLAPEEVKNTDGKEKQDCEINAGKRLTHFQNSRSSSRHGTIATVCLSEYSTSVRCSNVAHCLSPSALCCLLTCIRAHLSPMATPGDE